MATRIITGNPNCEDCNLCNVAENVCIMGSGKIPAKIMVIGDTVGFSEDRSGIPFKGKTADLIIKYLLENEVDCSQIYFTHAVKCRTPEGKPPSGKEIKACNQYLKKEIERVKPEFVLTLGATALKAATNKAKIMEIHGNPINHKDGITYFPTFSPGIAMRDPKKAGPLKRDIRRFAQLIRGENTKKHRLNLTIVDGVNKLKELILDINNCDELAFDIETTGLNRFAEDAEVTMVVISTISRDWVVPFNILGSYFNTIESQRLVLQQVIKASKTKLVIMQNGKFDNLYLEVQYELKLYLGFDTMLAAHLLNENRLLGLKNLAQEELDAHQWDIDLNLKKGQVYTAQDLEKLCEYAAWDGYFTIRLKRKFEKQLFEDMSLYNLFWQMVMPVARAYENIEKNGTYINIKKQASVKLKTQKQMRIALRKLDNLYDNYYRKCDREEWRIKEVELTDPDEAKRLIPIGEVNWNSAAQIGKILFDQLNLTPTGYTPKGKPSTAEDFITRMAGQHPILEPLLDYRHAFKMMSSFIIGWEKRMVNDCYLFPGFRICGTVTGRPSSSDPNLQQVPRNVDIRSQVSAPEGWTFFEIDYSQLELRITANISGEPEMIRIFQSGGDIHTETASAVTGIPVEEITKEQRKAAKAVNFGFIYGMGWRGFRDYAKDKYGVDLTDVQSKTFRKRFFQKYYGLIAWHERQKRIVRSLKQVRTLTGRIRRLPEIDSPDQGLRAEAERNSINSPVQGFGAEFLLMALVDLDKIIDPSEVKICGTIHDALVGRVRNDVGLKWLKTIKETMENPSLMDEFGIDLCVPITADVSLGPWGLGEELDLSNLQDYNGAYGEIINVDS